MSRLTSWQKQMQRRKQRMEKRALKLSFNGGARIMDRRHPVEMNPDDESLSDCNFVEQGVSVEPLMFADESDPDIEDNLGDERSDENGDADNDPPAYHDRYAEMAKRFGIDDDTAVDDEMLRDIVAANSWEEVANDPKAVEVPVIKNRTSEDVVAEKAFIEMVNEQLLRRIVINDNFGSLSGHRFRSWKDTTTQAAQYLRHTWRGVHRIDTVRGAVPVTDIDTAEITPLTVVETFRDTLEFDDEPRRYKLLTPEYAAYFYARMGEIPKAATPFPPAYY